MGKYTWFELDTVKIFFITVSMVQKITTARDVFVALGGTAKVVKLLGVTPAAISTMRTNDAIPAHHFPKVQGALIRLGKSADLTVFNFGAYQRASKKTPSRRSLSRKR